MEKPVLISGVQPTGKLHIGNYLGALKNFVELQNSGKYNCYFFIADLHSLTEDFNPKEKPQQILELTADYLAAGLDAKKSTIFVQSRISAHSELMWILNTITPMGELGRMTQFKEKSGTQRQNVNVGLFDYPILMAADILLYKTEVVPVGEDQLQHLEFTRAIARKFNAKFGKVFIEPKPLLTEVPRLMSLEDPQKKMSKSWPAGCLFLDDSPEAMRQKIKSAVTDSGKDIKYDKKNKPAISNLMLIYRVLSNKSLKDIERKYKGKGYADFKEDLAEITIAYFKPFQKEKKELEKDEKKIKGILEAGAKKARPTAESTLLEVKQKVGLI
jgi:tryptophanyl-tRNA synthetase